MGKNRSWGWARGFHCREDPARRRSCFVLRFDLQSKIVSYRGAWYSSAWSGGVAVAGEARTVEQWLAKSSDYLDDGRQAYAAGLYAIAYDQLGYCVEAKAKAVVMRRRGFTEWTRGKVPAVCFTHSIPELIKQANLMHHLAWDRRTDVRLRRSWLIVKAWHPVRYHVERPTAQAIIELERAVADQSDGILQWLDKHL